MNLFLTEHGETILYGIISLIVVTAIGIVCMRDWKSLAPNYKTKTSNTNSNIAAGFQGKYPTIEVEDIVYAKYEDESFNLASHIKAMDCEGRDISEKIKIYGGVNILERGIYKIRCVVTADNELSSIKYFNVIVE